ncbi:MAG: YitT family protein [Oscillospiraceae bacterium]|nr:YitT family protein [Oscillospiraceae bacterium]
MTDTKSGVGAAVRDYILITLCCVGTAVVIYLFQLPNHFVFGGVTGLAVLLSTATPISFATYNIAINLVLLLAAFLCLGRDFGVRTVYVTLCSSLCYELLEMFVPITAPLTTEPALEAVVVTLAVAAMSAELFQLGACSGGTDIAAMILRKYVKMDIGKALLVIDFASVAFSFVLYDMTIGLFSLMGLLAKVFVIDNVLDSINLCKYFTIVCADPEPICAFIRNELNRGATLCRAQGSYSGEDRAIVLTAVRRGQAIRLRNFVRAASPDAFMVITNTSEIVGRGFLME